MKWHTEQTSLLTLFHKTPTGPDAIMRYLVRKYGWRDKQGRMSVRHTIKGKSDRFRVDFDAAQLVVRPVRGNGPIPYWTEAELLAAAGAKLRRLILVRGVRKKREVNFLHADAFEVFNLPDFIYEVLRGEIAIDFDVREASPGSAGLRDHGTKFRTAPDAVCRLYLKKERLT